MASTSSSAVRSVSPDRPALRGARSFSRLEPSSSNPLSVLQSEVTYTDDADDVSTTSAVEEEDEEDGEKRLMVFPEGWDELPSELSTLTDR